VTLLEREKQLAAAVGYLDEATAGHGRLVYVSGEAGIGKSSFVTRVLEDVGRAARSAVGACDGSATPAPLGPLVEMLPALPDGLWPTDTTRQDVFTRLLAALRDPPGGTPYLLVIEDAHWADEATLDLIRFLARRVHGCRALILVTFRPEDAISGHGLRVVVGDTATAAGTRRIDLPPLTIDGVATLAAEQQTHRATVASIDVSRLHAVTGGNAFFVTEALSARTESVPASVREAVLARVARLDESARRALEVVALAGARAEADVLDGLYAEGLTAIDQPLDRGLLRHVDGDIIFRHELARLTVAEGVPAGRAVHIHRRWLAALEARHVDSARLAHHAEAAGDSAAVLRHAPAAATRAAALGAHQEAARQYRRALRHSGSIENAHRAELYWALGYECYLTNRIDDAIEATREALDIWAAVGETIRVGDAWRCLSRLSWFAARNDVAEAQAVRAVELLEGSDTVELALAYSNRTQLRMLASDLAGTREWGRRTLDLVGSLPVSDRRTEVHVHALNNIGTIEVTVGNLETGRDMLVRSLDTARSADLHEHAARAYCNLVSTAVVQRRHGEAQHYLDEGIEYCTERDLDSWTLYLLGWLADLNLNRGDSAAARSAAETVLRRADLSEVEKIGPLVVVGLLAARTGADEAAALLGRAAELAAGTREVQRIAPSTAARCEAAWIAGDPARAAGLAAEAWPTAQDADCPWNRGAVATWLAPDVTDPIDLLAPPYAAERDGRWAEAARLWRETGSPYEEALALARSNSRDELAEAVRLFDRLGAAASAARARSLLRERGWSAPARPRGNRRADGLTTREAEVLTLVRDGLSDAAIAERLVISRRTAEHHVASILGKLGASSRRDLGSPAPGGDG